MAWLKIMKTNILIIFQANDNTLASKRAVFGNKYLPSRHDCTYNRNIPGFPARDAFTETLAVLFPQERDKGK